MNRVKLKTKVKEKAPSLADQLNQIPVQGEDVIECKIDSKVEADKKSEAEKKIETDEKAQTDEKLEADKKAVEDKKAADEQAAIKADIEKTENDTTYDSLFEAWDEREFEPQDYMIDVPIDSLESAVGYTSLFRQMHQSYVRMVAYYRSAAGGSLSIEDARANAFHACDNKKDAKKLFSRMMSLPFESLNFVDLMGLQSFAPRVAERFWEKAKREGRKEFESGHLAANINFPVGYMKQVWNVARYLGVRESFIDDWNPSGGIEVALVDMLAQSYFQWQFWLEQTVKRSQTREREIHPDYSRWLAHRQNEFKANGWTDGYWNRPYVSEQQAVEHAVQMADRFNRIFMRTLRQLRDLRRYAPVTINNPSQVNIAADRGQQVNISGTNEDQTKKIT